MFIGAFVGFLLGYAVQEKITGQEHGAGRWQRPSDNQMVKDIEGFVRWLSIPLFTAGLGAFTSPVVEAMLVGFVASASVFTLLAVCGAIISVLYLFYKKYVLGR